MKLKESMATEPAPRYSEVQTILAPKQRILVEDNLQAGLGVIPGATKSEEVKLEADGLVSGRGVIP